MTVEAKTPTPRRRSVRETVLRGPLGSYENAVVAIVSIMSIGTALVLHALGHSDEFVDQTAFVALGVIYGSWRPLGRR